MTIKQVKTGWQVDIQPGGRGAKRLKKTFKIKADALAWERHVRAQVQQIPDWAPAKKDARTLVDLCNLWYQHHGVGIKTGKQRLSRLIQMCEAMGNPRGDLFKADVFAEYRTKRLEAGISVSNINKELAHLNAVFNELRRLEVWKAENPLRMVRSFKEPERELSYLTLEQVKCLLEVLKAGRNPHTYLVAKVCLSTGARWDEAESLTVRQIRNSSIQFTETKSGKNRTLPIEARLEKELMTHHATNSSERLFESCYSAFKSGLKRAKIELPKGQLSHVLRHTFASHFMMAGKNILVLKTALGHQSLVMTMRYAHLAPDHLVEVKEANPMALLAKVG